MANIIGKNIIFIPSIDLGNGRSDSYKYSIASWKHFAEKNDCEVFLLEEPVTDPKQMPIVWQRYYVLDILEHNEINYEQVLVVDSDTIVHPECPNFFSSNSEYDYMAVANDGDYEWVNKSIAQYGPAFFNQPSFKTHLYVNGGFQIFTGKHKNYLKRLREWYFKNQEKLLQVFGKWNSCDQTCINFFREYENDGDHPGLHILPNCFNLQDLARKNLLYYDERQWWTDELHFLKNGYVYHFNAIPQNGMGRDSHYWIKRTYEELYGEL